MPGFKTKEIDLDELGLSGNLFVINWMPTTVGNKTTGEAISRLWLFDEPEQPKMLLLSMSCLSYSFQEFLTVTEFLYGDKVLIMTWRHHYTTVLKRAITPVEKMS